ncbi:hypothetical protein MKW98_010589 [Papaver atlanticum]|uniref:Uncharacterized protein n=1 Tax=Papaver atlanticum TaxID=357466 RepID=A0AAD4S2K2_9MAGN|nr:hypothetical protein MKW98_010589 [Papaver atlanticum]
MLLLWIWLSWMNDYVNNNLVSTSNGFRRNWNATSHGTNFVVVLSQVKKHKKNSGHAGWVLFEGIFKVRQTPWKFP